MEKGHGEILNNINKIMLLFMLILGIFFMFYKYRSEYFYLWFFFSFLVGISSIYVMDRIGLRKYRIIITLMIWLDLLGEIYFYTNFEYYDKILHIISPFFLCLIIYDLFYKNKFYSRLLIFFTVLGFQASFEIFEWLVHTFLNFQMLGVVNNTGEWIISPIDDTMIDLILGSIGSSIYLVFFTKEKIRSK